MDVAIINYMAERSVQDELVVETSQNAWIIVLSYLLMFIYVSIAIGSFPSKVHSGFLVGLGGIFIVIATLICGLGIMSLAQIGVTLISVLFYLFIYFKKNNLCIFIY